MRTHEQGARLSAVIGATTHVLRLLSFSLLYSRTVTAFFPDQPLEKNGWEALFTFSSPTDLVEYLFLASVFWPLFVYLGSWWMLFKKREKPWLVVFGVGATYSFLLAFLGFAVSLFLALFVMVGAHMGSDSSTMFGPAFWFAPPTYFVSSCCSLFLATHFLRSVSTKAEQPRVFRLRPATERTAREEPLEQ